MIDPDPEMRSGRGPLAGQPASVWPVAHGAGRTVGIALLIFEILIVILAFWRSQSAGGVALWLLWLLMLAMVAAAVGTSWLLRGLGGLSYGLDDEKLTVRWMGRPHVIALAEIVAVEYDPHVPVSASGWEPFWPGLSIATQRRKDGIWRVWATLPRRSRVRIRTMSGGIEISPLRPIRFLVDIDHRRARRPDMPAMPQARPAPTRRPVEDAPPRRKPAAPDRERPETAPPADDGFAAASPARPGPVVYFYRDLFRDGLLHDRLSSNLIALGVIIPLLMVAFLISQMEGVPDPVALHWDALGEVARTGSPSALWQLPVLSGLILVGNTALAALLIAVDRFLARLMLMATPFVQIAAAVALIRLVS